MPHHPNEERSPKRRSNNSDDDDLDGNESPYLPESLLEEIIVRLPLTSIFKLKCICKSWYSMLSDPSFGHKYQSFKTNSTPSWTLLCTYTHKPRDIPEQKRLCDLSSHNSISPTVTYLYLPSPCVNKILASSTSNGLLLCGDYRLRRYYIYSPFIRQTLSIPQPLTWVDYQVEGLVTRMDPHGVVVISYKVVQVQLFDYAKPGLMDVFCSESGAWTSYILNALHDPKYLGPYQYQIFSPPISLKETLYFPDYHEGIIMSYSPYVDPCKVHMIHLPDRDDEEQEVPDQQGFSRRRICGTCRGRLTYYSANLADGGRLILKVWELVDDKEGKWCLVHGNLTGSNNDIWLSQSSLSMEYCPIGFDPFDQNLMYFGKGECIHSYHMATRKLELLHQLEMQSGIDLYSAVPYVLQRWPTLIPPPTWAAGKT